MPKIIRNDIEYCSSSSFGNASNILYNNIDSSLSSTSVQGAVSELEEKYENISNNYLPLTGGTMTGILKQKDVTLLDEFGGLRKVMYIVDDDAGATNYGSILIIGGSGLTYVGAGEAPESLHGALGASTLEVLRLCSDNNIELYTNCNTVANRVKIDISNSGAIVVPANTDYTTAKCRNIKANTSALTAGTTALSNGYIHLTYS